MLNFILKDAVKNKRRTMTAGQRAASLTRVYTPRYPHRTENALAAKISKDYASFSSKVMAAVSRGQPAYDVYLKRLKKDSFESDLDDFLKAMLIQIVADFDNDLVFGVSATSYISSFAEFIRQFSEKELENYFMRVMGVPLTYTETWWREVRAAWEKSLAVRARGTLEAYVQDVRTIVQNAVKNEIPFERVVEQVMETSEALVTSRAEFLARDLTGTLIKEVNQRIQQGLGMDFYLWATMRDELVRGTPGGKYPDAVPSHYEMDGLLCSWNNPGIYSEDMGRTWQAKTATMPAMHPGEDWQCRCLSLPYLLSALAAIDKELAMEEGTNG